jgi:hypothetical protein
MDTERIYDGVLALLDQPAPETTIDQTALLPLAEIPTTVARQLDIFDTLED